MASTSRHRPRLPVFLRWSVHLLFNNLSTSIFRLLVSDHRSHYSTRVLHTYRQDTYRQVGEQKSPWIRGRRFGSSTGNITFVTTVDTFRVFALHNIHSFASDRNELSHDAWWLRILKESACIWLDNNQHVFVRSSNVIVARVYLNEFLIGSTLFSFHGSRWKFESRNSGRETYIYGSIQRTSFVLFKIREYFRFLSVHRVLHLRRIYVALSSFAFVERYL